MSISKGIRKTFRAILFVAIVGGIAFAVIRVPVAIQPGKGDYLPGYYGDGIPSQQDIDACQIFRSTRTSPMEVIYDPATDRWMCETMEVTP